MKREIFPKLVFKHPDPAKPEKDISPGLFHFFDGKFPSCLSQVKSSFLLLSAKTFLHTEVFRTQHS